MYCCPPTCNGSIFIDLRLGEISISQILIGIREAVVLILVFNGMTLKNINKMP